MGSSKKPERLNFELGSWSLELGFYYILFKDCWHLVIRIGKSLFLLLLSLFDLPSFGNWGSEKGFAWHFFVAWFVISPKDIMTWLGCF